ncbi:hypothetical protein MRB53_041545 [Persea americana]|nr:hypothetical protein MRB53_041545 [Persea americana]
MNLNKRASERAKVDASFEGSEYVNERCVEAVRCVGQGMWVIGRVDQRRASWVIPALGFLYAAFTHAYVCGSSGPTSAPHHSTPLHGKQSARELARVLQPTIRTYTHRIQMYAS